MADGLRAASFDLVVVHDENACLGGLCRTASGSFFRGAVNGCVFLILKLKSFLMQLPVVFIAVFLAAATCSADVKLPSLLSDHMVLQRDEPVPIWGWAEPGEKVVVAIAGQTHETETNGEGQWRIDLTPLSVGDPLTLVVEGNNRLERTDILVGEVWVCSGQSNMGWPVVRSKDAQLELLTANHPQLRLLTVTPSGSQTPQEDFKGSWQVCTPKTAANFSAVGYFFGLQLQRTLNVPVGLIDNAWGGSSCEAWVRRDLLETEPIYGPLMERWKKTEAKFESGKLLTEYQEALAKWEQAREDGKHPGKKPLLPEASMKGKHRPANLYNARVLPLVPYAFRGVIWYQGESNASRAYQYREMFPLMIQNWRDTWGQGDFPFYWVQLADYKKEKSEPGNSAWAELREAQTMTRDRLKNTGEAVTIDLGEGNDIHPVNKLDVGLRLARWALARDYGLEIPCESPRFESLTQADGKITVTFRSCGNGLHVYDHTDIRGFAVAGKDKKWVRAKAKIVAANQVEVGSKSVAVPVAVRYAWADNPVCNLVSKDRLPVTPFRSDDWPRVTVDAR